MTLTLTSGLNSRKIVSLGHFSHCDTFLVEKISLQNYPAGVNRFSPGAPAQGINFKCYFLKCCLLTFHFNLLFACHRLNELYVCII